MSAIEATPVTCAVCDGDRWGRLKDGIHLDMSRECRCCKGHGRVTLPRVSSEYLYAFREHERIVDELVARSCVGWVRDRTGTIMPGSLLDIAEGCEVILRYSWAEEQLVHRRPLNRFAALVKVVYETTEKSVHAKDVYELACLDQRKTLTELECLELDAKTAERDAHDALLAYFIATQPPK